MAGIFLCGIPRGMEEKWGNFRKMWTEKPNPNFKLRNIIQISSCHILFTTTAVQQSWRRKASIPQLQQFRGGRL